MAALEAKELGNLLLELLGRVTHAEPPLVKGPGHGAERVLAQARFEDFDFPTRLGTPPPTGHSVGSRQRIGLDVKMSLLLSGGPTPYACRINRIQSQVRRRVASSSTTLLQHTVPDRTRSRAPSPQLAIASTIDTWGVNRPNICG